MNDAKYSVAFQAKVRRWRIIGGGLIALAVVAAVCVVLVISAKGGFYKRGPIWQEVAMIGSMVVGMIALVAGPFMLVQIAQQITFYDAVMSGSDQALARWQCTPAEAAQFIAMEAARLKVSNRTDLYMALVFAPVVLILISLRDSIDNWTPVACAGGGAILAYILWRIGDGVQFRAAKRRADTEIIMAEEGIVAGPDVFTWRSLNCGLVGAKYEKSEPGVLTLTFQAGTTLSGPTGPQCFNVRVPVTAGKADVVRGLVSSCLAKHLVG
ncbi:MAG: hypothetical protein M3N48_13810 [Verrucomicrobiota bacterium]|nr:hypothetical protein [Verrucomicrobiota bacterium]